MKRSISILILVAMLLSVMVGAGPTLAQPDPVINEFVFNHTGLDTNDFIEIFGAPSTDYSAYTIVEVEGDGASAGLIDDATFTVGTTDANGFWWTGYQPNIPENGTNTLLLVTGYSGAIGMDIDTNNDGVIDTTYWTSIVDDVAVHDGGVSDYAYASVVLTQGYDGNPFTVGGASRIPNGIDTNTTGDWMRNDYDGAGLPGFSGTPDPGEAGNTPNLWNEQVTAVSLAALGASSGGVPAMAIPMGLGLVAMLTGGSYLALRHRRK